MSSVSVRTVTFPGRAALLGLLGAPGAAFLEGWSDDGRLMIALPWPDEVTFLQEVSSELHGSSLSIYDAKTTAGFWTLWQQHGGWWSEKAGWRFGPNRKEGGLGRLRPKPKK